MKDLCATCDIPERDYDPIDSTQSTSAVQIVHVTIANIYTAAKDSARKKVLTDGC